LISVLQLTAIDTLTLQKNHKEIILIHMNQFLYAMNLRLNINIRLNLDFYSQINVVHYCPKFLYIYFWARSLYL